MADCSGPCLPHCFRKGYFLSILCGIVIVVLTSILYSCITTHIGGDESDIMNKGAETVWIAFVVSVFYTVVMARLLFSRYL